MLEKESGRRNGKKKESPSQNRRVGRYATYMISYNTLPWFTFTQFTCNAYNCPLHSHSGTAVNITVSTTANKPCTKLQTSLYPPTAPHFHHHRQYSHARRALSSSSCKCQVYTLHYTCYSITYHTSIQYFIYIHAYSLYVTRSVALW